eukprot:5481216-Amphidinium_carterae.1
MVWYVRHLLCFCEVRRKWGVSQSVVVLSKILHCVAQFASSIVCVMLLSECRSSSWLDLGGYLFSARKDSQQACADIVAVTASAEALALVMSGSTYRVERASDADGPMRSLAGRLRSRSLSAACSDGADCLGRQENCPLAACSSGDDSRRLAFRLESHSGAAA